MTDEEHVEQLRVRLSAAIETRKTIVAGRTPGALTVEELRKVADLDDRETELHREIDATQRRAAQAAQKEAPVADRFQKERAERDAKRKAIVAGRKLSEMRPDELMAVAHLNDEDERADLERRGAITSNMTTAQVELARSGKV